MSTPQIMLPGHDYTRNYQGFNVFADNAKYEGPKELPDWFTDGANQARFTEGYYHPLPEEDRIYRNKVKPENENAHILRIQNMYKERDPYYLQRGTFNNLYNYAPGTGPRFGSHNGSSEDINRMPESLVGKWSAKPLTYPEHRYYPTREEKYRQRDPDNKNISSFPRDRVGGAVINPEKYKRTTHRTASDLILQDRINTTIDVYQNDHKKLDKYMEPVMIRNKVFDQRQNIPEIQGQYKDTYANLVSRYYESAKTLKDHCDRKYDGRNKAVYDRFNFNMNALPKGMEPRKYRNIRGEMTEQRLVRPNYGTDFPTRNGEYVKFAKEIPANVIHNAPDYRASYYERINKTLPDSSLHSVNPKMKDVQNTGSTYRKVLLN